MATLILALSGRALAQAARRAGADVVVADLFGDVDTRSLAEWHRLPGSLEQGIDGAALLDLARELRRRIDGIVYGAGFEANPGLLGELARIAPLVGNLPEVVAAVKDPFGFADLLRRLDLPHPEVAAAPRPRIQWLRKQRGGSGGAHIESAEAGSAPADGSRYFQALTPGAPVSALFVANGCDALTIGLSEQWAAPTPTRPFRYGGCAGPIHLAPKLVADIERACRAITAAVGLVGLNSLDTLVGDRGLSILELNPRPGATLDLFDHGAEPIWNAHVSGVGGELPAAVVDARPGARAALIVYADRARLVPPSFAWDGEIADIPEPDSVIAAGMPICTILAAGRDAEAARNLAERRGAALLTRLPLLLQASA